MNPSPTLVSQLIMPHCHHGRLNCGGAAWPGKRHKAVVGRRSVNRLASQLGVTATHFTGHRPRRMDNIKREAMIKIVSVDFLLCQNEQFPKPMHFGYNTPNVFDIPMPYQLAKCDPLRISVSGMARARENPNPLT